MLACSGGRLSEGGLSPMADWFLTGDDLSYLVEVVGTFLAYGLGFGCVLWLIGAIVHVIADFVRY